MENEVYRREYAVEIFKKSDDSFVEQIDVFETYEEAEDFRKDNYPNTGSEYYSAISIISYDKDENEIALEIDRALLQ